MRGFFVNKKTGFKNLTPDRPVIIRDFRGKLFYSTEGLKQVKKFNLPEGQYLLEKGNIKPLRFPVKFKLTKLPKPERRFPFPNNFVIFFDNNPNKCTIKWQKKQIVYDDALRQATLPVLIFMLYHEHGHSLYHTEKYADAYSRNMMIKRGYNPSQIGKAPLFSLSSAQYQRKKLIVNSLI